MEFEYRIKSRVVTGISFMIVGVACMTVAVLFIFPVGKADSSWMTTDGRVVEVHESKDSEGNSSYAPVVEFVADDGEPRRVDATASSSDKPAIGKVYEVAYPPGNPHAAKVLQQEILYIAWIFVGGGAVAVVVGGLILLSRVLAFAGVLYWCNKARRANT